MRIYYDASKRFCILSGKWLTKAEVRVVCAVMFHRDQIGKSIRELTEYIPWVLFDFRATRAYNSGYNRLKFGYDGLKFALHTETTDMIKDPDRYVHCIFLQCGGYKCMYECVASGRFQIISQTIFGQE